MYKMIIELLNYFGFFKLIPLDIKLEYNEKNKSIKITNLSNEIIVINKIKLHPIEYFFLKNRDIKEPFKGNIYFSKKHNYTKDENTKILPGEIIKFDLKTSDASENNPFIYYENISIKIESTTGRIFSRKRFIKNI